MMKLYSMATLVIILASILAVAGMAQNMTANQSNVSANGTSTPQVAPNATQVAVPNGTAAPTNVSSNTTTQGELLVKFNTTAFASAQAVTDAQTKANAAIGATETIDYTNQGMPGLICVKLPPGMPVQKGIEYYSSLPNVAYAEVNTVYSIATPGASANQTTSQAQNQIVNTSANKPANQTTPGNQTQNLTTNQTRAPANTTVVNTTPALPANQTKKA